MVAKHATQFNYEGGLGIESIYKSVGPHRHPWLAEGPLGGFWSWGHGGQNPSLFLNKNHNRPNEEGVSTNYPDNIY